MKEPPYHPPVNWDHYYAYLLGLRLQLVREVFRRGSPERAAHETELAMLAIQEEALRS